jgi:hypothetical protein
MVRVMMNINHEFRHYTDDVTQHRYGEGNDVGTHDDDDALARAIAASLHVAGMPHDAAAIATAASASGSVLQLVERSANREVSEEEALNIAIVRSKREAERHGFRL